MLFRTYILTALLVLFVLNLTKASTLEQQIDDLNKRAKDFQIQKPKISEEIKQKAKESYEYTQTQQFKQQVENFKKDIGILMGIETPSEFYQTYSSGQTMQNKNSTKIVDDNARIYIFISSSIPEVTLRNYIKDASQLDKNVYFVMRGAIGGISKLMPTATWVNNIIKKNPFCEEVCEVYGVKVLIDPFLFRKYKISKVPAVVFALGVENPEGLSEGLETVKVADYWVSYGDVSLNYHLKLIEQHSKIKIISEQ